MNRDDIIRMAHKCGLCSEDGRDSDSIIIAKHLEQFANLVAAAERDFKFSTIEEAMQSMPTPTGQPQLTDDEARFADAFTALIKAGYGKEAEIVLKCKPAWQGLTEDDAIQLLPVMPYEYEVDVEMILEFTKAIEAKLKEKNSGAG